MSGTNQEVGRGLTDRSKDQSLMFITKFRCLQDALSVLLRRPAQRELLANSSGNGMDLYNSIGVLAPTSSFLGLINY